MTNFEKRVKFIGLLLFVNDVAVGAIKAVEYVFRNFCLLPLVALGTLDYFPHNCSSFPVSELSVSSVISPVDLTHSITVMFWGLACPRLSR